jgi:cell division protein FtsN
MNQSLRTLAFLIILAVLLGLAIALFFPLHHSKAALSESAKQGMVNDGMITEP